MSNSPRNETGASGKLPKLTEYQQKRLEKALEYQKMNITGPQVCMNKEFKGQAFRSSPEELVFKDYTVNEPHVLTFLLTNVSNTFCSFKILPIPDEYRDYFEVYHKPPGRMSAGISCKITIRFIPDVNLDIDTYLPILAQTGQINLPIQCTYKKAIINAIYHSLDFEQVIFGEEGVVNIELKNTGALPTLFAVKNAKGETLKDKTEYMSQYSRYKSQTDLSEEKEESLDSDDLILKQLKFQKTGKIEGYSSIKIPITYRPTGLGKWDTFVTVSFENFMHSSPIKVDLKGECIDIPIFIEQQVYDLQICLVNNIYREELVFRNRGKKAMKVQMIVPPEMKKFISLNPSFGYIQANSPLKIWMKFTIKKEFFNMCQKYKKGPNSYDLPLKLVGSEQTLPVEFIVRVKITSNVMKLDPNFIDFGLLYENTGKRMPVLFENTSDLPQEIHFYPLPKTIVFEPMLIPIKILPREKLTVDFIYRGHEVKEEQGFIRAKIVTGTIAVNNIKFGYRAQVFKSPIKFSPLKIEFPALQIGERSTHIMSLHNSTQKPYLCEFFAPYPEVCGLRLTPMYFTLPPSSDIEVSLEYTSSMRTLTAFTLSSLSNSHRALDSKPAILEKPSSASESKPAVVKGGAQPKKKTKKELEEEQQLQLQIQEEERQKREAEEEERRRIEDEFDANEALRKIGGRLEEFDEGDNSNGVSQHYTWLIPCYFRPVSEPETSRSAIYVEVNTVCTSKILVADRSVLDFGEISVGFRKIEELLITNLGDKEADLRMDLLPLFGGFHVLNALRKVKPGKTCNVVIQFEPHNQQDFKETLRIFCKESSISIKLKGKSIKPEVKIDPESGILDIGSCLNGEIIEKSFKVKNASNFALDFKLSTLATGLRNHSGLEAFMYFPAEGKIPAFGETIIKVKFNPERVSESYYNLVMIDVPNQKHINKIYIRGCAYPRQAFITNYNIIEERPEEEALQIDVERPLDFLRVDDTDTIIGYKNKEITLTFKKEDSDKNNNTPDCYEKKMIIGSCKLLDSKLEKATAFDITIHKDENSGYFDCSALKGNVAPGNREQISFKFKPPATDKFIANIEAFKGIGQWVEVIGDVKISGGLLQQGMQDLMIVKLVLRAYIKKI